MGDLRGARAIKNLKGEGGCDLLPVGEVEGLCAESTEAEVLVQFRLLTPTGDRKVFHIGGPSIGAPASDVVASLPWAIFRQGEVRVIFPALP